MKQIKLDFDIESKSSFYIPSSLSIFHIIGDFLSHTVFLIQNPSIYSHFDFHKKNTFKIDKQKDFIFLLCLL